MRFTCRRHTQYTTGPVSLIQLQKDEVASRKSGAPQAAALSSSTLAAIVSHQAEQGTVYHFVWIQAVTEWRELWILALPKLAAWGFLTG